MLQNQAGQLETATAEYWATVLDAHGVQFAVLDACSDRKLLHLLQSRPEWTVDFDDGKAVILAHVESLQGDIP